MYKTIRHGENSLQYTILPQSDEFRCDGKIISSNVNSKNHKYKKSRKRSFFAYLGLLFVCIIIIGAVLVPFLVSTECLPNPTNWFINSIYRNISLDKSNEISGSTTHEYSSKKLESQITTISDEFVENTKYTNNFLGISSVGKFSSTNNSLSNVGLLNFTEPTIKNSHITVSTRPTLSITPTEKYIPVIEEIIPSVNTLNTKKSNVLPFFVRKSSVPQENKEIVDSKKWMRAHWAFIDPSTYFQWAGYKSEDSILLPAILGATLIGIIIIITLCLIARKKRSVIIRKKRRNKIDHGENGEDNTILLTSGTISDEE